MLADSSVWIDYLRDGTTDLAASLRAKLVRMHPMVLAELALGMLPSRRNTLGDLAALPRLPVASYSEVLTMIERHELYGRGIGFVDAHLVASCRISGSMLWTLDRRLHVVAAELGVAHQP